MRGQVFCSLAQLSARSRPGRSRPRAPMGDVVPLADDAGACVTLSLSGGTERNAQRAARRIADRTWTSTRRVASLGCDAGVGYKTPSARGPGRQHPYYTPTRITLGGGSRWDADHGCVRGAEDRRDYAAPRRLPAGTISSTREYGTCRTTRRTSVLMTESSSRPRRRNDEHLDLRSWWRLRTHARFAAAFVLVPGPRAGD